MVGLESNIKLGDRIVTKRIGAMIPSTVMGIVHPEMYMHMFNLTENQRWAKHYPDWNENLVVISKFDEPTRHITFEEHCGAFTEDELMIELNATPELKKRLMKRQYEAAIPETFTVCYPIEDLEVL